jgi:hypothetical protein
VGRDNLTNSELSPLLGSERATVTLFFRLLLGIFLGYIYSEIVDLRLRLDKLEAQTAKPAEIKSGEPAGKGGAS